MREQCVSVLQESDSALAKCDDVMLSRSSSLHLTLRHHTSDRRRHDKCIGLA